MALFAMGMRAVSCMRPMAGSARPLYVKVRDSPSAALERLSAKSAREGIDEQLKARKQFVKPTLRRQKIIKNAKFNAAKRVRLQLFEELLLDKKLLPF